MSEQNDYSIALADIENALERAKRDHASVPLVSTLMAASRALKVADRLMQEPTDSMLKAGQDAWLNDPTKRSSVLFKAMTQQLMKELEK